MQLDRAQISIHERSWSDNLDLALHVIRRYAPAIVAFGLMGILPAAVANHLLLAPTAADELSDNPIGLYYTLVLLVLIEAPLATALVTIYLGQALFVDRPSTRTIFHTFRACVLQMFLLQFLLRALMIFPLITIIFPYGFWPYLSEVILLERNPLVSRGGQISTLRRSARLHRGNSGQFMLEGFGTLCIAVLLTLSLSLTGNFLAGNLFGISLHEVGRLVVAQGAMWLVAVYFTVARFLNYLNQRIRDEGWEVELNLKAERDRLERQLA